MNPKDPLLEVFSARFQVIDPGLEHDPLVGDLRVERIDTAPSFQALSYAWGSAEGATAIQCCGQAIRITANLNDLLRRARSTTEPKTLWADQICIDQSNHEEKAHQVQLMGSIYRAAARVWIWLGGDEEHGAKAASLVQDVNATVNRLLPESGSFSDLPNADPDDPIVQDDRWTSLFAAFEAPWFYRVWVVQEAGLASDPWVLFGRSEFDFTSLLRALRWRLNFVGLPMNDYSRYSLTYIHSASLDGWKVEKSATQSPRDFCLFSRQWTLLHFLDAARELQATDPRDYIFSFLGHPFAQRKDNVSSIVTPDYRETTDCLAVFQEFAVAWLKETQDPSLLLAVDHDPTSLGSDYPSWIPRWNRPRLARPIGLATETRYNASVGLENVPPILRDPRHLQVRGVFFEVVRTTSEILNENDILLPDPEAQPLVAPGGAVVDFWKSVSPAITSPIYVEDGQPAIMSLTRLLTTANYYCEFGQFQKDHCAYSLRLAELSQTESAEDLDTISRWATGGNFSKFAHVAHVHSGGRVLLHTENGLYGVAGQCAKVGDLCFVIQGCHVPFLLRPAEEEGYYRIISEAYMLDFMEGMVRYGVDEGWFPSGDIILV